MMANKGYSCSPIASKPNSCNNARNSEVNNPMRRSFSGNPFIKPSIIATSRGFSPNTPANSPSDYPRRNSIGRESIGSLRDYDDKENGKDPNSKPARVRSPAASKGTKNFMSPTISAASKINASPKKKVLNERNECIRSSVTFSDTKSPISSVNIMEENDSKAEMGSNQKKVEASYDSVITDLCHKEALTNEADFDFKVHLVDSKSDTDLLSETVTMEKDCVSADGKFKISPRAPLPFLSPVVAPLDADPSLPPYDPKTNYLSPRPQFLHYRPNPRIEHYLGKEREQISLEESFVSETSSDTEVSEEVPSEEDSRKESEDVSQVPSEEDSQKESDDVSQVLSEEDSQKESDDVSQGEMMKEEVEDEEEKFHVSEPNPICSANIPKETVEAKMVNKPHFFTRSMCITLLLVLAIACVSVSVTDPPLIDQSVLNNIRLDLYVPPEMIKFAKANIDGLAHNFQLWSANSFSYICKLISDIRGEHQLGPLQYANLTDLLEDHLVDGYLVFGQSDSVTANRYEQNIFEPISEREVETEAVKEKGQPQIETDEDIEDQSTEGEDNDPEFEEQVHQEIEAYDTTEEVSREHSEPAAPEEVHLTEETEVIEVSNSEAEQIQERVEFAAQLDIKPQSKHIHPKDQPVVGLQAAEAQPGVSKVEEPHGEIVSTEIESTKAEDNPIAELDASTENPQTFETVGFTLDGLKDKISMQNMLGASLVVLSLLAATAFTYAKTGKTSTPSAAIPVEQPMITKKLDHSFMSVSREHTIKERRLSSQNWQTEFDIVGESCPSEMSSFQKSSIYSKKELKGLSEAQSQERKPRMNRRRESLASSDYSIGSLDSPSYGSFTTYEKILSKHGNGDEEMVTPVRRSSRIKKQVTSP